MALQPAARGWRLLRVLAACRRGHARAGQQALCAGVLPAFPRLWLSAVPLPSLVIKPTKWHVSRASHVSPCAPFPGRAPPPWTTLSRRPSVESCPDGKFKDPSTSVCTACHSSCATCAGGSDASHCTQCADAAQYVIVESLANGAPVGFCSPGDMRAARAARARARSPASAGRPTCERARACRLCLRLDARLACADVRPPTRTRLLQAGARRQTRPTIQPAAMSASGISAMATATIAPTRRRLCAWYARLACLWTHQPARAVGGARAGARARPPASTHCARGQHREAHACLGLAPARDVRLWCSGRPGRPQLLPWAALCQQCARAAALWVVLV